MNAALIAAGCLAILGAAVHGAGGERLVVRELSAQTLPPTRFGGPRMTKAMIHVAWHIATVAILTAGAALVVAGALLDGDASRAVGLVGAVLATGFAAVTVGLGAVHNRSPRSLLLHPGPILLTVTAALAWWGAL